MTWIDTKMPLSGVLLLFISMYILSFLIFVVISGITRGLIVSLILVGKVPHCFPGYLFNILPGFQDSDDIEWLIPAYSIYLILIVLGSIFRKHKHFIILFSLWLIIILLNIIGAFLKH